MAQMPAWYNQVSQMMEQQQGRALRPGGQVLAQVSPANSVQVAPQNGTTAYSQAPTATVQPSSIPPQYQGGVVPMTAEPLHQWEKSALTGQASGVPMGGANIDAASNLANNFNQEVRRATNPLATEYMQKAGGMLEGVGGPISAADIEQYFNPYQQNVEQAALGRLDEYGKKARAALVANLGERGSRSFGDTSTGVRLSGLDQELLSKAGDISSGLLYQGWQDALGQANTDRGRQVTGAQTYGNLGQQTQGITNSAADTVMSRINAMVSAGQTQNTMGRTALDDQLTAGNYVRNYNQGINDFIGQESAASNNSQADRTKELLALLNTLSGGQGYAPTTNSAQQIGGLLQAGAGVVGSMTGGQALPWQQPGMVKPKYMGGGTY